METFIDVARDSDFPLENLPFGIFSDRETTRPRPGVALGRQVVDVAKLHEKGLLTGAELNRRDCLARVVRLGSGKAVRSGVRRRH